MQFPRLCRTRHAARFVTLKLPSSSCADRVRTHSRILKEEESIPHVPAQCSNTNLSPEMECLRSIVLQLHSISHLNSIRIKTFPVFSVRKNYMLICTNTLAGTGKTRCLLVIIRAVEISGSRSVRNHSSRATPPSLRNPRRSMIHSQTQLLPPPAGLPLLRALPELL